VKASTVLKAFDDAIGAFRLIQEYSTAGRPIHLNQSELIRSEKLALKHTAHFQGTRPTPVCTADEIDNTVEDLKRRGKHRDAAHLIITWLTAQRPPDISRLLADDVTWKPSKGDPERIELTVLLRVHKTRRTVPPYCLMTLVPSMWKDVLVDYLRHRQERRTKANPYLFPVADSLNDKQAMYQRAKIGKQVIAAVKLVNPVVTQGSLRKSALLTLASDSTVSTETVLRFSRHKDTKTLMGYLNLGAGDAYGELLMHEASRRLHPRRAPQSAPPISN
jgi:hypothetical protein